MNREVPVMTLPKQENSVRAVNKDRASRRPVHHFQSYTLVNINQKKMAIYLF